ncbi:MBL fold metallo-hydrolase [Colwellia sp. MEBiC06753]
MKKIILIITSLIISKFALATSTEKSAITVTPVAKQVYMLSGDGGNIGVLATEKGLMLIDNKFAPLAEQIEQAMKSLVDQELKYVINTHYHGDHTGSNSYFSHQAPIFAHSNVRKRLAEKSDADVAALPVVTYEQGVTIYLENEEVQLTHLPSGHTDSDTVVYFKNANVLHTGDLFFEIGFPYVDLNGGGNVRAYLANVKQLINRYPDDVVIIPGHGKLSDKKGYQAFATMIEESIALVEQQLKAGKSEQEILAQGIHEKYKHLSWSFINEEKWLKTLIKDLK